jgi:4a-hydroxytetrahydrobiopterin dehydratase
MIKIDESIVQSKLSTFPGWKFENNALEKKFLFSDFREAMCFMVKVSYNCEKNNHHPEWTNVYNKLTIRLSTHDAAGVTEKDFQLASEIDIIYGK